MKSWLRRLRNFPVIWKIPLLLTVLLMVLGWMFNTPPGLLGKSDAVGYAVCHRIDLRSYHLGDRALPLCARCTGMYLGACLGLGFQYLFNKRACGTPHWTIIALLGLFVIFFAVDGINSYLTFIPNFPHLYQPRNFLRLFTGTGMGIAISAALYPAFNGTIWVNVSAKPGLSSFWQACGLILAGIITDFLVISENPLALYPLALISAGGVLLLLTMIYCMVWVILFNKENQYEHAGQLVFPLVAGFGLALLQIILIDAGRYLLTGTWDGFHIGWLENQLFPLYHV